MRDVPFSPVLWNESNESDTKRIEQVWFSGVHSDVGGGYPRFELALVSLNWMMSKAEQKMNDKSGLCFIESLRDEYKHRCDWDGVQHDSRAGLAAYYRYKPGDIERICNDPKASANVVMSKIHRNVFERIKRNVVPCAPAYLPLNYEIISTRASAMSGALDVIYGRRWLYAAFVVATLALLVLLFSNSVSPATDPNRLFCNFISRNFV